MAYFSSHIETLRRGSPAVRQRISLLLALVLTIIIFGLWLLTWQTNSVAKNEVGAVRAAGPVSGAGTFVGEQVRRVGLGFQVLLNQFK